jgi:thioesterase domain-containing protein
VPSGIFQNRDDGVYADFENNFCCSLRCGRAKGRELKSLVNKGDEKRKRSGKVYTVLRDGTKRLAIVSENLRVLALQPVGKKLPFFLINSFPNFIEVVKLLGDDHPVLSLIGDESPEASRTYNISGEAAAHVESILAWQPDGPFMLGGCSASGVVAFEAAQQLVARGHKVALLVLFDTPSPDFIRASSPLRMSLEYHWAAIERLSLRQIPGYATVKLLRLVAKTARLLGFDLHSFGGAASQESAPFQPRIDGYRAYRAAPYRGTVLIVRRHADHDARHRDEQLGWGRVVAGRVHLCEVSATEHLEIFKADLDQQLVGRKLRQLFDATAACNELANSTAQNNTLERFSIARSV